jgi:hypothetical protein
LGVYADAVTEDMLLAHSKMFGNNRKQIVKRIVALGKYLKNGERGRNRTYNLLIKSQLLCQLSYAPVPAG